MSSQARIVKAPPTAVWEVLADGWLYPLWVVGASRIRDVDPSWPEQGSQIAHSVGAWPMLIDDTTEVTECRPGQLLALRARAWPAGEAAVEIRLTGSGSDTEVTMQGGRGERSRRPGAQAGARRDAEQAQRRGAAPARLPRRAPGVAPVMRLQRRP